MKEESEAIIAAVDSVLKEGWRTRDIADAKTEANKILGTEAMGKQVLDRL
jgi:3-isopropylmalate dehydrogenase